MSRRNRIQSIYRKELIDILRDRRTMLAMVIVPVVIYPIIMLGFIRVAEREETRLRSQKFHVRVADEQTKARLGDIIHNVQAATTQEARPQPEFEITTGQATSEVLGEEIQLVVALHEERLGAALPDQGFTRLNVEIIYNEVNVLSRTAKEELASVFRRINEVLRREGLRSILPEFSTLAETEERIELILNPIAIEEVSTATERQRGGWALGQIVPFILVLMTITGAIYPAIDLTAGERERGTLETLMVTPVPVLHLIVGKFLVVATIGLLAAVLNVLCVGLTMHLGGLTSVMTQEMSVQIPYETFPIIIVCMIPFAMLFAAILVAVCSFARTFKEAQNYVMPVIIGSMIPAISVMLPTVQLEGATLVLPVGNMVLLTRELFQQTYTWSQVVVVLLSTTLYAAAAVAVATKLFGQEAVLFADAGSYKTLIRRDLFVPADRPSTAQGLLLVALLFPASFYAQSLLADATGGDFVRSLSILAVVQFGGLFLGVPLLAARYLKLREATTFRLKAPPVLGILAAVLIGASSWAIAHEFFVYQSRFMPPSPILQEAFGHLQEQLKAAPIGVSLLLMALGPAVTEEWLFRGFLLSGLSTSMRKWTAIAVCGLIFGVFHFYVDRVPVTALLGMLLAYMCWQTRSIWPAMLTHALHNGVTVALGCRPHWFDWMRLPADNAEGAAVHLPMHVLVPAGICFVAGCVLLATLRSLPPSNSRAS